MKFSSILILIFVVFLLAAACGGEEDLVQSTPTPTILRLIDSATEAESPPPQAIVLGGALSEGQVRYNVAVSLQQTGRLEEAITEYDEAIRLEPEFAPSFKNRGAALAQLGFRVLPDKTSIS